MRPSVQSPSYFSCTPAPSVKYVIVPWPCYEYAKSKGIIEVHNWFRLLGKIGSRIFHVESVTELLPYPFIIPPFSIVAIAITAEKLLMIDLIKSLGLRNRCIVIEQFTNDVSFPIS